VALLNGRLSIDLEMEFHEVPGAAFPNPAFVQGPSTFDPGGEIPDFLLELLGRGSGTDVRDGGDEVSVFVISRSLKAEQFEFFCPDVAVRVRFWAVA
jgi:hypothetical protein